jgi:hypothetical protein
MSRCSYALHAVLAQADSPDYFGVVLATLAIIVVAVGGFWGIRKLREYLRQGTSDDPTSLPGGFSIGELRQLARDGKITPDEFERAKAKVLDAIKSTDAAPPPTPGAGPMSQSKL